MTSDDSQQTPGSSIPRGAYPYALQSTAAQQPMHDLLSVFWRRRGLILACIVIITLAAGAVSVTLTPQYRSSAQLMLTVDKSDVINETSEETQAKNSDEIETYTRLLRSRSFASAVIERLELLESPYFNARQTTQAETQTSLPTAVTDLLNAGSEWLDSIPFGSLLTQTGLAGSGAGDVEPAPPSLSEDELFNKAVSKLIAGLSVDQEGLSSIIKISFTSTDPVQSASIANAVAEFFIEDQLRARRSISDEATGWLDDRVEELRQNVIAIEREIAQFRIENKIINVGSRNLNDAEIAQLTQELFAAEARVSEKESKLGIIRRSLATGDGLASVTEVTTSPAIASIRQQEFVLLGTEAQLREEFGPNHPRILELEAEKERLEQKTKLELEKIVAVLTNELGIAKERAEGLRVRLVGARETLGARNQAEVELAELEREAQANRDLYTRFLNRLKFLNEEQELIESGARLVSSAVPSTKPSFPQPSVIFVAGFVASILTGGLLALVREGLERGLRHERQVENALGLPTLGMVPTLKKLRKGLKPHSYILEKPLSGYAEAVRNIHVAMQYGWVSKRNQIILITSSLPNEGKTTLAMSLAVSAAESGSSTLLIDLDFRNPSIGAEMANARPDVNIINYLNGSKTWAETLHRDPRARNLAIIPGCVGVSNPMQCLESEELKGFLREMRKEYDQIILDVPPVLGISDTRVAARLADAVILAVRWGHTKIDVAQTCVQTLAQHDTAIAGVVLTRIDVKKHAKMAFGDAAQYHKEYKRYYVD